MKFHFVKNAWHKFVYFGYFLAANILKYFVLEALKFLCAQMPFFQNKVCFSSTSVAALGSVQLGILTPSFTSQV